jgi:hypothetical protein
VNRAAAGWLTPIAMWVGEKLAKCRDKIREVASPEKRWFSRLAVESLDTHCNPPKIESVIAVREIKTRGSRQIRSFGAGLLKAEETHDS